MTSLPASTSVSVVGSDSSDTPRQSHDLSYMHRPPTILPNYGKRYGAGLKLKTNVPRVLLYDNVTQQTILDVQLAGLKSQQYKTSRELEMHMKSFLHRRQAKEKNLEKLTKVPHWPDHQQFLEENRTFFPAITGNGYNIASSSPGNTRIKKTAITMKNVSIKKKKRKKPRSLPHTDCGANSWVETTGERRFSETSCSLDEVDHMPEGLPVIQSAPCALVGNERENTQNFLPRKRVGFRFEKGDQGFTRVFYSFPEIDSMDESADHKRTSQLAAVSGPISLDAIEKVETLPELAEHAPVEVNAPSLLPGKNVEENTATAGDDRFVNDVNSVETESKLVPPLQDSRFASLQRILVRQQPPNDGFIELSPSFVRHYPDLLAAPLQRATTDLASGRRGHLPERHLMFSAFSGRLTTSPFSGGRSSVSEEEEVEGDEVEDAEIKANSALRRLGQ